MKQVIPPVDRELIKQELTQDKLLRKTNKANNEIYIFDYSSAPNTMREVGRLREEAFRKAGGGTGKEVDIDEFDCMNVPYMQLIVWSPEDEKILGGYRYIDGTNVRIGTNGQPILATSHLFHFSEEFLTYYLPYTIELARSFVTLEYQFTTAGTKGLFALDNLWDGLGALIVMNPHIKYFFGKVTMYPSYHTFGRNMILYFINKYFKDKDKLVTPIKALQTGMDEKEMDLLFSGSCFKDDYKTLNTEVRRLGFNVPPLVNAYMGLSPTMKMFGTAINDEFGDVEESGILIAVDEILKEKRERHIESYLQVISSEIKGMTGE
ncbi:MAG: GNAT family N-acetyltransferase [Bacteroidales bacterium]|jgi:hypothetical protein|nr:GNAT family N-acetyltransferase [Bacteroidales bacterium]